MEDPTEKLYDYKGWFWDHVNRRMYRWHELELLMKERTLKEKNNADQLKNQRGDV